MIMKRILTVAAAIGLGVTMSGCAQIDTGNTGVESTFGQYKEQTLPPGVYFTVFKTIWEINTKEVSLDLSDMQPKAKDNVTLQDVDVSIYFRTNPAAVGRLMTRYAGDLSKDANGDYIVGHRLMQRMSREAVYVEFSRHNAFEMHTQRALIAANILQNLQSEIDRDAGKGSFEITNVIIRNIVTDPRLEEAIKQAAEVEFQIRKKQQELLLARAEADRRRIEAEGEAIANRIISDSLSANLIELRRIETMRNFATTGTHTVILPQNVQPFITTGR